MHLRSLTPVLGALAAALAISTAQAAPIVGGISFTDGLENFGTTNSIVSQMTLADDNATSIDTASSCAGAFDAGGGVCALPTGFFAHDYNIGQLGAQLAYDYAGFQFFVTAFGPIIRTPLSCNGSQCFDFLNFAATGFVQGNGITPTAITISWSAQGICNDDGTGHCSTVTTASWSASIGATGAPFQVPEPATAALIGMGLIALGLARRRRI